MLLDFAKPELGLPADGEDASDEDDDYPDEGMGGRSRREM